MASAVSICSNALLMVGAKPINNFTEAADRVRLAANLYPSQKKAFLRSHPWNCAIVRTTLAPMADAPAFGYSKQFQLPGDCIRLLDVGSEDDGAMDYRVEGKRILFSGTALPIRYITSLDEGSWDDSMVTAMELRMAALFAFPIAASSSLAQSFKEQADQAFRAAKNTDGQEDPPQSFDDSPLLSSRQLGGGF
jgi:hypothetical protein